VGVGRLELQAMGSRVGATKRAKLMKKGMHFGILGTLFLWFATSAHAQVFTYTDEATYLNDLADFGFGRLQEGFEDDATWGGVRFSNAAPQVTSQGIVWTANNGTSQITTGSGTARTGSWAVFAFPHGITTGDLLTPQEDGFVGTSTAAVFGVGGWLVSNTGGAQVQFMLDGAPVGFTDPTVTNEHKFFGAIDTAGFTTFEIVETEGNVEDQENIFGDDFTLGTAAETECGNGIIDAGENCDDGGTLDGDCCSSSCQLESAGSPCPDGAFCNGEETCDDAGACLVGTPVDCSDGVGCTDDLCDEGVDSCVNAPNDTLCGDGLFCTGDEFCHTENDCSSSGDPCPTGTVCDEGIDTCESVAACGDGILDSGEECDDANTLDGDCCSAICEYEPAGSLCADGQFCNGEETCDGGGTCQPGDPVECGDAVACTIDSCDEASDSCVSTSNDNNCPDDGLFCTGQEICDLVDGCVNTGNPCGPDDTCSEETSTCHVFDLDIRGFQATKQVKLERVKPIRIKLTVRNVGTTNEVAPTQATVVGVQNGTVIFGETRAVHDPVGNGQSRFEFGPYTPTAPGDITWTATISDGNPDDDTATAVTRVTPRR